MAEKIWIVSGCTGEYSDRTEWAVVAFRDEATAKATAEELTQLAKAAQVESAVDPWEWEKTDSGKKLKEADSYASIDYTGTDYTAFELELR